MVRLLGKALVLRSLETGMVRLLGMELGYLSGMGKVRRWGMELGGRLLERLMVLKLLAMDSVEWSVKMWEMAMGLLNEEQLCTKIELVTVCTGK